MKILIFNPLGIGDVLFSTPIIRGIKETYPEATISYICNKRTFEILRYYPDIERLHVFEKDEYKDEWKRSRLVCLKKILVFFANLQRERFDVVFDLSLGCSYTVIFFLMGIKERVGFNYRERGRFLTKRLTLTGFNEKHAIEYYAELAEMAGVKISKKKIHITISQNDTAWARGFLLEHKVFPQDTVIGLVPGCGASWGKDAGYRRWQGKNFALVGDMLASKYKAKLLIFGDRNELDLCSPIASAMRHTPVMACGKTSLGQFLALAKRCDLVITNDGGPLHIAVGLDTKTVSIFGPVDENIYGPYPKSENHIVISNKKLSCRPCYKNFRYSLCDEKKCLESITPEDVFRGAETILKADRGRKISA